jgi:hypothetical protein
MAVSSFSQVSPILEELCGAHRPATHGGAPLPTFRLDHVNVHNRCKAGFQGHSLHGGSMGNAGVPHSGVQFFRY